MPTSVGFGRPARPFRSTAVSGHAAGLALAGHRIWGRARPAQLALSAAAELVPAFLVGLAAGAWVDRLAKRPVLIACYFLLAPGLLAVVPLAALGGWMNLPCCWSPCRLPSSVATIFFDVAYEAYLPSLVNREQLLEGNSKLTASAAVAEFSAFGSAGWLGALHRALGHGPSWRPASWCRRSAC